MTSAISTTAAGLPMERLKGMEDFNNWKFMMRMILLHEGMYECVETEEGSKDERKNQKALAKICLAVSPSALNHVRDAKSPHQAWMKLQCAYENKGLSRRLGLLRALFGIKLKDTEGMESYVAKVSELAQQLKDIEAALEDEFIAIIMLSGLTSDYDPLIMALENSGIKLSSEIVKSKLLQEYQRRDEKLDRQIESALVVKKLFKCYRCNKTGHFKKDCPLNTGDRVKQNKNYTNKEKSLLTALSVTVNNNSWYIDSGATNHMCNDAQIMHDIEVDKPLEVYVANGERLLTAGRGKVQVNVGSSVKTISNVFYVPKLSANLLSVSELTRKGYSVSFDSKCCKIFDDEEVVATASYICGVYQLNINSIGITQPEIAMTSESDCEDSQDCETLLQAHSDTDEVHADKGVSHEVWHKRLAHLNSRSMKLMKDGMVTGMYYQDKYFKQCEACVKGKQCKLPFPKKSTNRSEELLGLVHTDVCGPMEVPSFSGAYYFVLFIDDYSRKTFIYFMRRKNEVFEKFKIFKALVENQTDRKIKVLRSDNGGEYINIVFQDYLKACGIKHQTTVPHCSAQNGVAERANRTIVEKARCLLQDAGLSKNYWAEAVNTAVYLKNRSPTKAVMGTVPEEKWTCKKVNVQHLRIFGSIAYALENNTKKFDARSKKYIFVGYCEETKGYRLIDPSNPRNCVKARHVTFMENIYIKKGISNDSSKSEILEINQNDSTEENFEAETEQSKFEQPSDVFPDPNLPQQSPESDSHHRLRNRNKRRQTMFNSDSQTSYEMDSLSDDTYVPGSTDYSDDSNYMDVEDREPPELAQLSGVMNKDIDVPETVQEALECSENEHWKAAMTDEYNSFITNNCWTLMDLPDGKKAVKCKWIFSKKRGLNGELLKYKARLVAKGCSQKYGIDYNETFSPVVRYSTIRILLALAVQYDMFIEHLDVKTAFLNGDINEIVFMEQPDGYILKGSEHKVYKLNKAVYGLKQAAKSWYEKINKVLTETLKFRKLSSEPCVFVYSQEGKYIIIALYVDDIMLFSTKTSQNKKEEIKKELMKQFEMKDLGQASHILGMSITKDGDKLKLDQSCYINKILERFQMTDCKPVNTPLESGLKLQKDTKGSCSLDYRNLIGSLMYLAVCSRPDISYAVSYLSQFNDSYSDSHWKAAKRVLRYLKGTSDYQLSFEKGDTMAIIGYTDADWAANEVDRRSYTGYVYMLGKSVVSWESRKQRTVALSSAEAEYMAISDACKEALFLRTFLSECLGKTYSIELYNDSQSAQKLARNLICHSRTKHIDIRHHFIRQLINDDIVNLLYISTDCMLADVLTKGLSKDKHVMFTSLIFQET